MIWREWSRKNSFWIALAIIVLIVAAVSLQSLLLRKSPDPETGVTYTFYNNFMIFRGSFFHLLDNLNLYQPFPQEQYDLFKYSPTFALLFAPLALLPVEAGLFAWILLNALVLFVAFWKLPVLSDKKKLFALGFVAIELITSLQNSQSNALMAGLIILAFVFLEKHKPGVATLLIVLSVFIKIYSILALAIFIFYPRKSRPAAMLLLWFVVFGLLPLILVTPAELWQQYRNWFGLLKQDQAVYGGLSVISWLKSWFGLDLPGLAVMLAGAVLFALPLVRMKHYQNVTFRMLFLASALIWMVIFNHMAESPTFVIAVSGVAIWFFMKEKRRLEDIILLALVFIFTILSPTDIFPPDWQNNVFKPYAVKAVPCIFVWVKLQAELLCKKF